jgi:hypothetical protein
MQSHQSSHLASSLQILKQIIAQEGTLTLFQGLIPRLATYGFVKLSLFTIYEKNLEFSENAALAGSCAGVCNTIVSCPPDVVKCRFQVQNRRIHNQHTPVSVMGEVRDLLSRKGIPGLYLGWRALAVSSSFHFFQIAILLSLPRSCATCADMRRFFGCTILAGGAIPRPCGWWGAWPA